jgi:O-antigen/teichoic acid export membrane protein
MSLAAKAAKAGKLTSIYAMGTIIAQLVALFTVPFFTHYLSKPQMGIVQLSTQFIMFLGILIQLGLLSGLKCVYFHVEPADRPQLVRSVQIGQWVQGIGLSILLSFIALPFLNILLPNLPLDYGLKIWLWWMIVWGALFTSFMRVGGGLAQFKESPGTFVTMTMTNLFIGVILGVVFVLGFGGFGFHRQVGTFLGMLAGGMLASWYMWHSGAGRFCIDRFVRTFRVGLTFVPHAISGVLVLFANSWMVAGLDSAGALGLYGIAVQFAALLEMTLQAVNQALYPLLANLMREATEQAKHEHIRFYMLLAAITVFISLGLVLFAPVAIRILTAPEYHAAAKVVVLLVVAWVFQGFYLIASQPVFFFGGGLYMTAATFTSFVIQALFAWLLIPLLGVYGAGLALLACFAARLIIAAYFSHKLYPLKWQFMPLIKLALAATALGAVDVMFVDAWSIWISVPVKIVLAGAYVPLVIWSGIISKDEALWGARQAVNKIRSRFGRSES